MTESFLIICEKPCYFHARAITRRRKAWFHFTHFTQEQNVSYSQTQLDDIAHDQTITCRQLFAGHVVSSCPMKRKKDLHRMIKLFID